jgi:hypothetical protein
MELTVVLDVHKRFDGETRTRTGDTTIFRQMLRTLEQAAKCLQNVRVPSGTPRAEVSRD